MTRGRLASYVALAIASAALSGCGLYRSALVPDDPGVYAVTREGGLQRLDGPVEWEQETWPARSDMTPDVRFVVAHPSLADGTRPVEDAIRLRKVGWLRSEVGPDGTIAPVDGVKWVAADIAAFTVPLEYARVDDRDDVIEALPKGGALEPGLYSLELETGAVRANGRVGVNWTGLDKKQYASAYCIDRYATGAPAAFLRCSEQASAAPTDGLLLHLVDPERRTVGSAEVLIVRGLVVNTSTGTRRVPTLRAVLSGKDGRPLHSWQFAAPDQELGPGQSVSFQTSTDKMVAETANLRIEFAPQVVVRE